ncbi:MAG: hypothetical protein ABII90_02335 [Bacteroidota bacterium]
MKFRYHKINLLLGQRNFKIAFALSLVVIYFAIFSQIANFTDTALLSSDTWSYQSIAVNFTKGNGFHRSGKIEKFEEYKFACNYNPKYFNIFNTYTGIVDIHRNLGYPLFLSMVYKVFGISPLIAKHIQLLLLIIVAAFLPWIGYCFWKSPGFFSGLIASPLFIAQNFRISELIMSESLLIFTIFLMVFSYIYFESRKNFATSIILGLTFGISMLVKGSLVFIPFLFFSYLLIRFYKTRENRIIKNLLITLTFFVLPIIPWTTFVNIQKSSIKNTLMQIKTVLLNNDLSLYDKGILLDSISPQLGRGFLSDRDLLPEEKRVLLDSILPAIKRNGYKLTDTIINPVIKLALLKKIMTGSSFDILRVLGRKHYALDGHNEYVSGNGGSSEWRINKDSFYNNDNMGDASSICRIVNFYRYHPLLIFKLMWNKINSGFSHFKYLWVILILFIVETLFRYSSKLLTKTLFYRVSGIIVLPLVLLPVYYPIEDNNYFSLALLMLVALLIVLISKGKQTIFNAPAIFYFVFINFVLITIFSTGEKRWTQVMDFIIVLSAIHYLFKYYIEVIRRPNRACL